LDQMVFYLVGEFKEFDFLACEEVRSSPIVYLIVGISTNKLAGNVLHNFRLSAGDSSCHLYTCTVFDFAPSNLRNDEMNQNGNLS